ncbi:oligosaccharide flippase family protein [bacterium]|nr:oligosaccharide flippase family protein [bacterium]
MRLNFGRHSFLKNVVTLMSGTVIAQMLTILASPVLSRLFSPEDFALLASFTSVTSLCVIFCSGKYEMAILLPEKDGDARNILRLSLFVCALMCCLLPLIIIGIGGFNEAFNTLVENDLILIAVVFVLCSNMCESFRYYFLRKKQFKAISSRTVVVSLTTVGLNLLCGYFFYSRKVFVTSTTIAQIVALILFLILFFRLFGKEKQAWSFELIKRPLVRYWKFPAFTMSGQLINSVTLNMPILVLVNYFSDTMIGLYAFVYKIASLPMTVIGTNVTQVFMQRVSQSSPSEQKKIFLKTSAALFLLILPPAVIGVIFAPQLFSFIFGEKWIPAATLARLMAPMLVIRFATSPVSAIYSIKEKNILSFIYQIVRLVLMAIGFVIALSLDCSFEMTIFINSLALIAFYLLDYITAFFLCGGENPEKERMGE